MGERSVRLVPEEWYHCYNRGTDKRKIFMGKNDYERMLALLCACNSIEPVHVSNFEQGFRSKSLEDVLRLDRRSRLVDIGAYSLKPNHVDTDQYFNRVLNYIHANHADLYEPKWKNGIIRNKSRIKKRLVEYRYSSLSDYCGSARPESLIINKDAALHLLDSPPSLDDLLDDARTFARYEETL